MKNTTVTHTLLSSLLAFGLFAASAEANDLKFEEHVASQIHAVNQMEMQMGQLAHNKGSTAEVRDFGDRIYKDHSRADDHLMQVATDMKLTISQPVARDQLERNQQKDTLALMRKLAASSGPAFDRAFLKGMYSGHRAMIAIMTKEQPDLGPSPLDTFVTSALLPELHQHEDIAMNIENKYYA
jgi:putative membrane protein